MFDPYRKWLGIPAGKRPPTHYQLLGISPDEHDPDVIKAAVVRQSAYVRNFQTGKYGAEATRLLNEIGEARVCLLDPTRRARYDSELHAQQPATGGSPPATAPASRPPNSSQAAAGLYGPDLAGSRLPGAGVPSSGSRSLPTSPVRPPASNAPAAIVPVAPPARPAGHAPPSLAHDPVWRALEREAGPDHTSPRRTLLPSGRSSAAVPVWLWFLPVIAAGLLAITLVVHFTAPPPAHQVAQTSTGAGASAGATEARMAAPPSSTSSPAFRQGPSAGSLRPNQPASRGGDSRPDMGGATGRPPASTSPFGAGYGRPAGASGFGGSAGASFGSGASAGNAPLTSPNATAPRKVAPASGLEPNQSLTRSAQPSDTNNATKASGRGQFNVPVAEVSAASLADGSWLRIALAPGREGPLFAHAGGPFVAIGTQVRHLTTREVVGETGTAYGVQPLRALSAKGEYYAVGDTFGIDVQRTEDGKTLHQIRGKNFGVRLEFLSFGAADRLIAVTTNKGQYYVQSWNLTTGKLSKDVMLESFDRRAALSDDGKLLATPFSNEGVVVYDLRRSPSKGKAKVLARIPVPPPRGSLTSFDGLRFSPDGSELIGSFDRGERIFVWDQTGQVVFEERTGFDLDGFWSFNSTETAVECDPAGRGWLLGGRLFLDRRLRRVTWMIAGDSTRSPYPRRHFIDAKRVAVSSSNGDELIAIQIPWTKIEESLAARDNAGTPAWLGPKQPVDVKFNLRDTAPDTAAKTIEHDLKRLLVARLATDGITVAADQPATFAVDYSEHSRSTRSPDSGQEIAIADEPPAPIIAHVTITLLLGTDDWPFWRTQFVVMTHGNDAVSPRAALYNAVQTRLERTIFPYFVPRGADDLVNLPVRIRP